MLRNQESRRESSSGEKELTWCAINQRLMAEIAKLQERLAGKERELGFVKREMAGLEVRLTRY